MNKKIPEKRGTKGLDPVYQPKPLKPGEQIGKPPPKEKPVRDTPDTPAPTPNGVPPVPGRG